MKRLFLTLPTLAAAISLQAADYTNFIVINLDDVGYGDFSYNVITQHPEEITKLNKIADEMRKDLGDNLRLIKPTNNREHGLR